MTVLRSSKSLATISAKSAAAAFLGASFEGLHDRSVQRMRSTGETVKITTRHILPVALHVLAGCSADVLWSTIRQTSRTLQRNARWFHVCVCQLTEARREACPQCTNDSANTSAELLALRWSFLCGVCCSFCSA